MAERLLRLISVSTRLMTSTPTVAPMWVPTPVAAVLLGLSGTTLRRYARGGFLQEGEHYRFGVTTRSPWQWHVDRCSEQLRRLSAEHQQQLQQASAQ